MMQMNEGRRAPWVGLAAAVWVQMASGNAQNFPLYSHTLKSVLGYSQLQLAMLGLANDLGENFGLLAGKVCNRCPPWIMLLIGGAACFFGYGLLWLAVSGTVAGLPYWALWFGLCIATNSSTWLGTAVLVTNMRNFPVNRGTVAGILKGYVGLSAAVYTEIYTGVLRRSSANLLLFLTLGLPAICFLMMYFVRPCTPSSGEDSSEPGRFNFTQIASIVLCFYLLAATIVDDVLTLNDTITYILFGIMILLLLAPFAIPLKMTLYGRRVGLTRPSNPSEQLGSGETGISEPLLNDTSSTPDLGNNQEGDDASNVGITLAEGETGVSDPLLNDPSSTPHLGDIQEADGASNVDTPLAEGETGISDPLLNDPSSTPHLGNNQEAEGEGANTIEERRLGDNFTPGEAVKTADFRLLFLVYFLGVGSGVTVLNNLPQIGSAAGVRDSTVLLCVFGLCNFFGRLGGGSTSEYLVRSRMLPRPFLMSVTQFVMAIVYILFASLNGPLYVLTALLGFCYGVQFSVMMPTASELFGLERFGEIYNFLLLGNPLGSFLFSGLLAGLLYDNEAAKQGSNKCSGANCFRLTFQVLCGVCTLGTFLAIILTVRLRPVYQMLYADGSIRRRAGSSEH